MSIAKPQFVTPDYSVSYEPNGNSSKTTYTKEHLTSTYEQFLAFREGLRELGFLPFDSVETDEVSFFQERKKERTIFFRFKAYREFVVNTTPYLQDRSAATQQTPDMFLFSAHVQNPETFGYSPKSCKLYAAALARVGINPVKVQRGGLPYSESLPLMAALKEVAAEELDANGIASSMENILRFWAIRRFIELGKSVLPERSVKVDPAADAKVYELVAADMDLYLAFLGISKVANPEYRKTGEFAYSVEALKGLDGIPHSYLNYIFVPEQQN